MDEVAIHSANQDSSFGKIFVKLTEQTESAKTNKYYVNKEICLK